MSESADNMIPARVQTALQYLHYCYAVTHTCDAAVPARDLTGAETAVQRAALDALRLYFTGEMDFAPRPPAEGDGDGQHVPVVA